MVLKQLTQIIDSEHIVNPHTADIVERTYKKAHLDGFINGAFIMAALTLTILATTYFLTKDSNEHKSIKYTPQYRIEKKKPTTIKEMFPEMHVYNIEDAINSNYSNVA